MGLDEKQVPNDKSEIPISIEDIREMVEKRKQEENKIITQQNKTKVVDSECLLDILLKDRIGKKIVFPVFQRNRHIYNNMDQYTEVAYEDEHFDKIKDVTKRDFYFNWCPFVGDLTPLANGIIKLNYEYNLLDAYTLLNKTRYSLFKITSTELARKLDSFYRPHFFQKGNAGVLPSAYLVRAKNSIINYMSYDCFPSSKYIENIIGLPKGLLDIYRKLYMQFNIFMNRGKGKEFLMSVANEFFKWPQTDKDRAKYMFF